MVPADAELTARPDEIPAWDDTPDDLKPVLARQSGTPVSDDLGMRERHFTGRVRWVEIDLGDDAEDADHLITTEERLSIAMARR